MFLRLFLPACVAVVLYGTSNQAQAQAEAPTSPPMVVLVGLDGADWKVVRHLWKAGELPHLRSIADRGVTADLATDFDARSPIIWTTMATGHGPDVHGIEDFVSDSAGAKSKPVESGNRTAKALWNITTERGLDALVLGWWASWPVEEIRGFSLTDRSAYPNPRDNTWPRVPRDELFGWRDAADAELGELYTGPPPPSAQDRLVSWVARDKLSTGDFDLAMIYLRTVDLTSHRMWRYFEPETFQPVSAEDQ
ncbi:MAG: alkaline phosphatase family protein, partial [Myxococcota bacterium]|nr:alkaline phosphatase family protein [Myxococcota bacterium]